MLATILKSPKATETTFAIIDTLTKVREVTRIINQLPAIPQDSPKYQQLIKKTGDLISDLVVPDELAETESSIELNLAVVKFK